MKQWIPRIRKWLVSWHPVNKKANLLQSLDKKHSNRACGSKKAFLHSEHALLSGSWTLSSISWERQTHIPIMTSVGREKKRLEGGREVEGRIVIAQRLSHHQRKLQQKKGKEKREKSRWGRPRNDNWSQKQQGKEEAGRETDWEMTADAQAEI